MIRKAFPKDNAIKKLVNELVQRGCEAVVGVPLQS